LLPIIPLALLGQYLEAQEKFRDFVWFIALIGLAYLLAAIWLANRTAHHIAFEDRSLISALKFTVYDLRFRLSFLPLVGHWFSSSKNKHEDDDDTT